MKKVERAEAGALDSVHPLQPVGGTCCQATIMPGHLQEGFGCVVTNQLNQLFDDESDAFEVLKAAENKKKEAGGGGVWEPGAKSAAPRPTPRWQANSCVKSPTKNPLPPQRWRG
ncbi:Plasminogen activator inhibitor 1 RNA-binding protein [Sciurus carolinensis]|uniref:Plasminogen activator inhibitor 1 RNA-binding protein n=1 Tax=Sciurus carolinensis TaxID=30640 RepID=A0AA41T5N1_SCICA|nr:Plasminogen activator inhibitor 1 RNA-binding protein [Sciurus carolinensis]